MLLRLLALFVVVPLVELTLLLQLAHWTDPWTTLALVIVTGVVGTVLARSQGWKTMRRIRSELAAGTMPAEALMDAAMIFCAGALLLTPGILTDAFGLSLLTPFCRRWYRRRLLSWFRRHFQLHSTAPPGHTRIIDSYVIDRSDEGSEEASEEDQGQEWEHRGSAED